MSTVAVAAKLSQEVSGVTVVLAVPMLPPLVTNETFCPPERLECGALKLTCKSAGECAVVRPSRPIKAARSVVGTDPLGDSCRKSAVSVLEVVPGAWG